MHVSCARNAKEIAEWYRFQTKKNCCIFSLVNLTPLSTTLKSRQQQWRTQCSEHTILHTPKRTLSLSHVHHSRRNDELISTGSKFLRFWCVFGCFLWIFRCFEFEFGRLNFDQHITNNESIVFLVPAFRLAIFMCCWIVSFSVDVHIRI